MFICLGEQFRFFQTCTLISRLYSIFGKIHSPVYRKELYISERNINKTKLLTQSKSESLFHQQCDNGSIIGTHRNETQGTPCKVQYDNFITYRGGEEGGILKRLFEPLWLHKNFKNTPSLVITGLILSIVTCTITVFMYHAKSVTANETSNKHLKQSLSSVLTQKMLGFSLTPLPVAFPLLVQKI